MSPAPSRAPDKPNAAADVAAPRHVPMLPRLYAERAARHAFVTRVPAARRVGFPDADARLSQRSDSDAQRVFISDAACLC